MENVKTEVTNNILTVTVDLSKNLGRSKSGKTIIVASSHGNKEVVDGIYMGLNIYKYPK